MKLEDKVIVITGGTKGLGAALASVLIEKTDKVVVASKSVCNKSNYLAIKTDVTNEASVKKLAKTVVDKFGRIDIWINNAGIWTPHAPIEKMNIKKVHELIEVNLFGVIYGSKYALIEMRKHNFGLIVNILSSSALDGGIGASGYCASKFAASGFTKSLRKEVEKNGVDVVAVYTRGIKTNLFDKKRPEAYNLFMKPTYVAKKIIKNMEKANPIKDLMINY